jgi:tetratricopeptide (TPR) repeat protein
MGKRRAGSKRKRPAPAKQASITIDSPELLLERGVERFQAGKIQESQEALVLVLSAQPSNPQAHGFLALIAQQRGDLAQALHHFQAVDAVIPPNEGIILAIAGTLGQLGRHEACLPYLVRAASLMEVSGALDPLPDDHVHDLIEMALVLLQRGRPEALTLVVRILRCRNPALAEVFQGAIDPDSAIPEKTLAICQQLTQYDPAHAYFVLIWARWLQCYGRDHDAQTVLRNTVEHIPSHWRAWSMLTDLAAAKQDADRAIACIREAIKHCPQPEPLVGSLIHIAVQTAAFDQAGEALDRALSLNNTPALRCMQVDLLHAMGKPTEALSLCQTLAHSFPDSEEVRLRWAKSLTDLGYFEEAQRLLARCSSSNHRVGKAQATWYVSQYRFAEAITLFERLIAARSADTDLLGYLMLTRLFDGDVPGAIELDQRIDEVFALRGQDTRRFSWRHGFQRSLLREFNTNQWASHALNEARRLPPSLQVPRLLRELDLEPGYAGFAASILVRLRQGNGMGFTASSQLQRIPMQIFQYWDQAEPLEDMQALMRHWQQPGWAYTRFNDQTAWDYLRSHTDGRTLEAFETAAHATLRADLLRLAVLAIEGGVWADADDRCCGSLEDLMGEQPELILIQENLGTLGNNFLAVVPNHPFMHHALKFLTDQILSRDGDNIWFISGPGALSLAFCHFYRDTLRRIQLPPGVRIFDTYTFSRTVAQHLPLAYKHRGKHWNHQEQRSRSLFRKPTGRPVLTGNRGELNYF